MNVKKISLLGAGGIIVMALFVLSFSGQASKGTLALTVAPSGAQVTIDKATKSVSVGSIQLKPGEHSIMISKDGFSSQTINVTIKARETIKRQIALTPSGTRGETYLKNNTDEADKSEDIEGSKVTNGSQSLTDKYPVLARLPFYGSGYQIDVGASQKNPGAGNIALYISRYRTTAYCKSMASKWMSSQGYSLDDYEIVYVNRNNGGR